MDYFLSKWAPDGNPADGARDGYAWITLPCPQDEILASFPAAAGPSLTARSDVGLQMPPIPDRHHSGASRISCAPCDPSSAPRCAPGRGVCPILAADHSASCRPSKLEMEIIYAGSVLLGKWRSRKDWREGRPLGQVPGFLSYWQNSL
jgi:hypothetical protein